MVQQCQVDAITKFDGVLKKCSNTKCDDVQWSAQEVLEYTVRSSAIECSSASIHSERAHTWRAMKSFVFVFDSPVPLTKQKVGRKHLSRTHTLRVSICWCRAEDRLRNGVCWIELVWVLFYEVSSRIGCMFCNSWRRGWIGLDRVEWNELVGLDRIGSIE